MASITKPASGTLAGQPQLDSRAQVKRDRQGVSRTLAALWPSMQDARNGAKLSLSPHDKTQPVLERRSYFPTSPHNVQNIKPGLAE